MPMPRHSRHSRDSQPQAPSAEHRFIASLRPFLNFRPSRRYPVGPGDDAAVRACSAGERLVLTTDCMVEGTHFAFDLMRPAEVGFKAMAANVSDCAAMGARPESALVDLVFAGGYPERAIRDLYAGFARACRRWRFAIAGGNLAAGRSWVVSITMVGRVPDRGRAVLRSSARPGDTVWVSGRPGSSAAGLAALRRWGRARATALAPGLVSRHIAPGPRLDAAVALAADGRVHAMIDISDGVAKEARTVAFESGAGMELVPDSFPIGSDMRRAGQRLGVVPEQWFLEGGEDYELLFTASPSLDPRRLPGCRAARFTAIGRVVRGAGVVLVERDGRRVRLGPGGWDHLGA